MQGQNLTLENIATMILKNEINSQEARDLIKNMENKKPKHNTKGKIAFNNNRLEFWDSNGKTKSYIQFWKDKDSFNNYFLTLQFIESYKKGKGYFSCLLKSLESLAKKENILYFLLEVDYHNQNAISIYESKGFYSLGPRNTFENIDRILMRKDLKFTL